MSPIEALRAAKVGMLTSFRRDGRGVGTPVGITTRDDRVYFTTRAKTWKVKRIANNPRVTFVPCTRRGKVVGTTVEGTARPLPAEEVRQLQGGFQYRLWTLIYRLVYHDLPVSYEFTPDRVVS